MTRALFANRRKPLIMGHRGAREVVPENTLAAFRFAIEQGVDAIELDVHLSQDGELVVMHDADIARTTDGSGPISSYTLAQLRQFDAGAEYRESRRAHDQTLATPLRIPTLQEVVDFVKEFQPDAGESEPRAPLWVNVEVKQAHDGSRYPGIEEKVLDLMRQHQVFATTVISSFDFSTLETVQTLAPEAHIYAIAAQGYFQQLGTTEPDAVVADLCARNFSWVAINKNFIWAEMVDRLHDAGLFVHTWVVNDVDELTNYTAMGIDAITTDRPDLLNGVAQAPRQ
jgi:glycerophosphoryl diester phosphodiesterase